MAQQQKFTKADEINEVHGSGTHVVILGAGASIASTIRNPEKNKKKLPAMNNVVEVVGLSDVVKRLPQSLRNLSADFEKLYSELHQSGKFPYETYLIESRIYNYFKALELPGCPTIYDYLVLCLRPKDVIATFNWDPFLYQAYVRNGKFAFTPPPGILHLHGNVSLGYNSNDKTSGPAGAFSKRTEELWTPTKLLYPVTKKNYKDDEFIFGQWESLSNHLEKASRVTVFGYRAPESDIEAIELMQKAWGTPELRDMEQFELIDVRPEKQVKQSWDKFIHSHHYDYHTSFFDSSLARHPRRTVESFRLWSEPFEPRHAFQVGNKVPNDFKNLKLMWEWFKPIVDRENESK